MTTATRSAGGSAATRGSAPSVGGLAVKLAGQRYLGFSLDRDKHAGELKAALGGLKGPLMKVAQLLATIPDALPPEYARELAQLQANAPAMGWAFVRRRMAHGARAGLAGEVRHASTRRPRSPPRSARSIAPSLPDGRDVGVQAAISRHGLGARGRPQPAQARVRDRPALRSGDPHRRDPCRDRRRGCARSSTTAARPGTSALYRHMLRDEPNVHVPEVVPAHSTDRLLTMDWLEGEPLLNWKTPPQEERDALAINMFRAWYVPFYRYGVIHGDPHLGNYTVRPDGSVNLMDFGCVRIFPPRFVRGSIELYRALMTDDEARAVAAYEDWGFTRPQPRDDRRAQPLGRLPLRPADGRPAAPPDRGHGRAATAARWRRTCSASCARWAACGRRASSCSWTAPRSASARCSSICAPRSTGTACSRA